MAKLLCLLLLALLGVSMATETQYHLDGNAHRSVQGDVARHSTTNHACSSARNAVLSVCVFLLASMATKLCALATTTGRPRKEDPNVLESFFSEGYLSYQ
ncbi:hypothetical protein M0R45_023268 [Rubus argutus]|uniref:Uncharacterized protein n=1 Tax=Rubus argutus TaxID=59490 RepID=A0AAW1WRP9_RUBAR